MPSLRRATIDDLESITGHRHRMFADNAFSTEDGLTGMDAAFRVWLRRHLLAGTYIGLLLEEEGQVLAGAGVYLMDWPPHFLHHEPLRAYLLNFYTVPEARGRGYARLLLQGAVDAARSHGASVVTLHASPFGKPIYQRFGFALNNEWILLPEAGPWRNSDE